jgi:hypothetical protein
MKTLSDLQAWAKGAPRGTLVPAETLAGLLADLDEGPALQAPEVTSWRLLLWTAPAECRIGKAELLEAVGRPASWLYRCSGRAAKDRIPHRRLDGQLTFVVGEVRRWLREREVIVDAGPMDENKAKSGACRAFVIGRSG